MLCFLAGIFAGHNQPNLIIVPVCLIAREMLQLPASQALPARGARTMRKSQGDSRRLWNPEYNGDNQYVLLNVTAKVTVGSIEKLRV